MISKTKALQMFFWDIFEMAEDMKPDTRIIIRTVTGKTVVDCTLKDFATMVEVKTRFPLLRRKGTP